MFNELVLRYTESESLREKLYAELEGCYSERGRHYHNLNHLQDLLQQILAVADQLEDLDAVLFALYYHDAVYDIPGSSNEERSAKLASNRLGKLNLRKERIERCKLHILATKKHEFSRDSDTNFFTDADLSILGRDWPTYKIYTEAVRKEYGIYPDLIYKPGRKKVIKHFLQMDKIFKTEAFSTKYERPARLNLKRELEELAI